MRQPYFKTAPGDPKPLVVTTHRTVRFEEVDTVGMVWHGRYPSYFEDARVKLGDKFGIGYQDFIREKIMAPIKSMHIDYHHPLRFNERFSITALLHWSDAVRINFEFRIHNAENRLTTTGYTVQLMLDHNAEVLFVTPKFYHTLCDRWRAGELA